MKGLVQLKPEFELPENVHNVGCTYSTLFEWVIVQNRKQMSCLRSRIQQRVQKIIPKLPSAVAWGTLVFMSQ